jgi:hypothetical protein
MRFPKSVEVGGMTYRVDLVRRIQVRDPETGQMRYLWGEIDYSAGVIRIVSTASIERRWSVLTHECLHAMVQGAGIEFDDTEGVVSRLEPWLFRFMTDNGFVKIEPLPDTAVRKIERQLLEMRDDDAVIE